MKVSVQAQGELMVIEDLGSCRDHASSRNIKFLRESRRSCFDEGLFLRRRPRRREIVQPRSRSRSFDTRSDICQIKGESFCFLPPFGLYYLDERSTANKKGGKEGRTQSGEEEVVWEGDMSMLEMQGGCGTGRKTMTTIESMDTQGEEDVEHGREVEMGGGRDTANKRMGGEEGGKQRHPWENRLVEDRDATLLEIQGEGMAARKEETMSANRGRGWEECMHQPGEEVGEGDVTILEKQGESMVGRRGVPMLEVEREGEAGSSNASMLEVQQEESQAWRDDATLLEMQGDIQAGRREVMPARLQIQLASEDDYDDSCGNLLGNKFSHPISADEDIGSRRPNLRSRSLECDNKGLFIF